MTNLTLPLKQEAHYTENFPEYVFTILDYYILLALHDVCDNMPNDFRINQRIKDIEKCLPESIVSRPYDVNGIYELICNIGMLKQERNKDGDLVSRIVLPQVAAHYL